MTSRKVFEQIVADENHPDHSPEIVRVRKISGQLEGIEKMILNRRHCPQILQQVQAVTSALNGLKTEIVRRHLNECVTESERAGNYSRLIEQVLEIVQIQARK